MSDEDPDRDDDGKLRSMRAVWLQMRDEDPPDGGLAELLAAARTKAETLTVPPWWQRLAMQLRRPAVFALASVMLVLGGALLIGRRVDPSEPPPRIEPGSADEATYGRARSIEHLPAPPAKPTPPPGTATPPPPPPPPPEVKTETPPTKPDTLEVKGVQLGFDGEAATQGTLDDRGGGVVLGGKPPLANADAGPPAVEKLRAQCDAAALRGDCAAVKSLVQTLERRDRQFRAKLAKDSPVNRCLAE